MLSFNKKRITEIWSNIKKTIFEHFVFLDTPTTKVNRTKCPKTEYFQKNKKHINKGNPICISSVSFCFHNAAHPIF